MNPGKDDAATWLEREEKILRVLRSRAKYKIDDGLVTRTIYADFVLTDRRVAIVSGLFWRRYTSELRPEHLRAVSVEKAFKGWGTYWRPAFRKVLLLTVRKDGKDARLGLAVAPAEVEAWRKALQAWLDAKSA
jgi:hypothetical protein